MGSTEVVTFQREHWQAMRGRVHADHLTRMQAVAPIDEVLERCLRLSALVRTVILDDTPEAIMGCGMMPGIGYPWLIKTDEVMRRFWSVIRAAPEFIAECLQERPLLRAEIPADDRLVARWLTWLEFRAVGPVSSSSIRWELGTHDGH